LAGLNVIVQSLSSQELMANQLNALGGAHQPRGVTTTMFKVIHEFFLNDNTGTSYSHNGFEL
jgi:hypothetical protein